MCFVNSFMAPTIVLSAVVKELISSVRRSSKLAPPEYSSQGSSPPL
jgi:hypothetical protein